MPFGRAGIARREPTIPTRFARSVPSLRLSVEGRENAAMQFAGRGELLGTA